MRITPAYAGKRSVRMSIGSCSQDHPRLRGEKHQIQKKDQKQKGSPPLTRGKAAIAIKTVAAGRITPAYAGKSCFRHGDAARPKDHPRLRGEKDLAYCNPDLVWGSPPLTRGKVLGRWKAKTTSRITPAYAGKSLFLLFPLM